MSDFQSKLNEFEKEIMYSWFHATGHKIGLSIQIENEVQDEKSTTRDIKACEINGFTEDLINEYCKHILSNRENIEKCNLLDFHMKEFAKGKGMKSFGCRCHKGATNFLIPYRYKNTEPTFYIFIGQFMLHPINQDFKSKFVKFENVELISHNTLNESQKKHIFPSPFVENKDVPTKSDSTPRISYVDFTEYVAYKRFVLHNFSGWINDYFEKMTIVEKQILFLVRRERTVYKPKAILQNFIDYINPSSILYHLKEAKEIKITQDEYGKNKMLDMLIKEIDKFKKNKKILNQTLLQELKEYSLIYLKDSGSMGKNNYINVGRILTEKIISNAGLFQEES